MRLLHISDVHCSTSSVNMLPSLVERHRVDIVVLSGDLECNDYLIEGILAPGLPVVGVPGNMDDAHISRVMKEKDINIDAGARMIGDVLFVGIGGRAPLSSLRRADELLREAGSRKTVIVSHHPPHGTKVDIAYSGVHAGLHELRALLERHQPLACLCGHIHESPGIDRVGRTLVVNPGPFSRGRYAVVDLEKGRAELFAENP